MKKSKKYSMTLIIILLLLLTSLASLIIVCDPYFHFHAPIKVFNYKLFNERYQNDGITRHFKYNAIITGTSMTENFKTSEFDKLFSVNSIKIHYPGASYKEINDSLKRAIKYNPNINTIIRSLDTSKVNNEKNVMRYKSYPTYLYDDIVLNDIKYLFNKDIFFGDYMNLFLDYNIFNKTNNTLKKSHITSFDEYGNKSKNCKYNSEIVLKYYKRIKNKPLKQIQFNKNYEIIIKENIEQNVISLARKHPNIDFYYFYTPYSIVWFDNMNQKGRLNLTLDCIKYATSLILEQKNIKLFSFLDLYETITNLDIYKDTIHYNQDINSLMLKYMKNDEHLLTKENYEEHFKNLNNFYLNYDYDSIFTNEQ